LKQVGYILAQVAFLYFPGIQRGGAWPVRYPRSLHRYRAQRIGFKGIRFQSRFYLGINLEGKKKENREERRIPDHSIVRGGRHGPKLLRTHADGMKPITISLKKDMDMLK
jgi:hypothetical protein